MFLSWMLLAGVETFIHQGLGTAQGVQWLQPQQWTTFGPEPGPSQVSTL